MQQFSDALAHAEQQFQQAAQLLIDGDAEQLEMASAALQVASIELRRLVPLLKRSPGGTKPYRMRVKKLAAGILDVRKNLLRRASLVDQALAVLLPNQKKITYSNGRVKGKYGDAIARSGAFRVFSA